MNTNFRHGWKEKKSTSKKESGGGKFGEMQQLNYDYKAHWVGREEFYYNIKLKENLEIERYDHCFVHFVFDFSYYLPFLKSEKKTKNKRLKGRCFWEEKPNKNQKPNVKTYKSRAKIRHTSR